jgi:hypothetical protein
MCEKDSKSVTKGVTIGHNPESGKVGAAAADLLSQPVCRSKMLSLFVACVRCFMGTKRSGIQPILTFLSIFCIHILLHTFLVHSVFYRGGGGLSQRVDEGCCIGIAPRPPSSNMLLLVACLPPLAVVSTPRVLVCMIHW